MLTVLYWTWLFCIIRICVKSTPLHLCILGYHCVNSTPLCSRALCVTSVLTVLHCTQLVYVFNVCVHRTPLYLCEYVHKLWDVGWTKDVGLVHSRSISQPLPSRLALQIRGQALQNKHKAWLFWSCFGSSVQSWTCFSSNVPSFFCPLSTGMRCFALSNFFVICSDRSSSSSDVHHHTLQVLHRAVGLLPHQCVCRPSFCSQVLVILTILQEVFHCHGWRTTAACRGFSSVEFCEHVAPKSWMSSPQLHYCHLILSGELAETVPAVEVWVL